MSMHKPQLHSGDRSREMDPQAHLAAIIESSDDAILSKSLDGRILSWNKAAERIFGFAAGEIIGQSILTLIPPERQIEESQIVARLQAGERIDHFETVRLTRDGRRIEVMVSISPMRDGNGEITGASKTIRVMTQQRQAERALLDSESRLRAVVESAVDGIITLDESGRIETINSAGLAVFGFIGRELVGVSLQTLIPSAKLLDGGGRLLNYPRATEAHGAYPSQPTIGLRKDGSLFPMDLTISEVKLVDRRIFSAIVRDITQRDLAERALVQAKETAEAASHAKERFLSILSHELRTPLTPVLADLTIMYEQRELPEDIRSRLAVMRRNVETEARLVDDLLDITRIAQGKIQLRHEQMDLHDAVRAVIGMLQSVVDSKSLRLTTSLDATQHHVNGDPGRIQQILLNLLSNAIKFTPRHGSVSIRSANDSLGNIEISVADTGAGLDAAMLPRLFNAFEQSEVARRLGGLGLGLSIAKSLTELHLGTLSASSPGPEQGACFCLKLATVSPASTQPPAVQIKKADPARWRVLLVEDHDDSRVVLARLLQSLGCQVTAVASQQAAIDAGEAQEFDMLISDIGLPDGSGLEVMRQLRSKVSRGVALSGYGQVEDIRKSREAGFDAHLIKPVSLSTLTDVLLPSRAV